jgi:tight adherence protein B
LAALAFAGAVFAVLMAVFAQRQDRARRDDALRARLGIHSNSSLLKGEDDDDRSRLTRLLDESGLGWDDSAFRKWTFTACAVGVVTGGLVQGPPTAFLLGMVGLAFFPLKAILARSRRLSKCEEQFPQALQLMVLGLRAGHALPGALALASREIAGPLSVELKRAVEEQALGTPISQVIARMAARLHGCEAAQTFAVAILVLEQTGGNLIAVIERIIGGARARTQYKARLRALTSEGRASATILGLLPLGFFLIAGITDPHYWPTLLGTSAGNKVLALVVVMWAMGGIWTYRLVAKEPT